MSPRCPHFLPNKRKVRRSYLDSHIFHIPRATGRLPPYTPATFHKFTKNCKARKPAFRKPCIVAHAWPLPTRLGSPYGQYPHTATVWPCARRDQRAGLRKPGANRSPQTPCDCDGGQPAGGVNARRRLAARRRRRSRSPRSGRPEGGACGADPRGTGSGWTRQKPADAASDPQDERQTTQAAGQARRHAGDWVRSLHFPTLSRIS